jgi:hypothetical protein
MRTEPPDARNQAMDEAVLDLIRMYRRRLATMEAALARVSDENLGLREQIQKLEQVRQELRQQSCRCHFVSEQVEIRGGSGGGLRAGG